MKKFIIIAGLLIILFVLSACSSTVANFDDCVVAGNPILESYPQKCIHKGETFVEELSKPIGGDKDPHNCLVAAGYSWCPSTQKCQRMWEDYCAEFKSEFKSGSICTTEYAPVCGELEVQCIKAPCPPIKTTFGNICLAENANAKNVVVGSCDDDGGINDDCAAVGGMWVIDARECENIAEKDCNKLGGSFNGCASPCRNDPEAEVCAMNCIPICVV